MSERLRIIHKEQIGTIEVTYRADLIDNQYAGAVQEKVVSDTFFDWDYPKIDERDPYEQPVQKLSFTMHLLIEGAADMAILEDILDSDEKRFRIDFFIDDEYKWGGHVLTDLIEYPEAPYPFTASITAKDLSVLEGHPSDLGIPSSRTRLSQIVATCLQASGLNLPIRSYTNITNIDIDPDHDFLFGIYHENRAFTDTGTNNGDPMSWMEVLEHICRAYNLIIRQAGGRWIIEQLPAVAKGDDMQFDYDADGLNPVSSVPNRTIVIDRNSSFLLPTSQNKVTGALHKIESAYNHKTLILNVPTDDTVEYTGNDNIRKRFTLDFENRGLFVMSLNVDADAVLSDTNPGGSVIYAHMRVWGEREGDNRLYMDRQGSWSDTPGDIDIELSGGTDKVDGRIQMEISNTIPDSVFSLTVEFRYATILDGGDVTIQSVTYSNINAFIYNTAGNISDPSATINYRYTRAGAYSVSETIPDTVLGDGPTIRSVGAPASSAFGTSTIIRAGRWRLRGDTGGLTLEELRLRERVSMRRKFLRNLRAYLWMKYSPEHLIEYDGKTWFFLGGRFQARDSRWDANILLLGYAQAPGDVFQTFVEEGGDPSGATEGTSGSGGGTGGGLTLQQADSRYAQRANNLSDLNDAAAALANLGVSATAAELNRLDGSLATVRSNLGLGAGDDVTHKSLTVNHVTLNNPATSDTHALRAGQVLSTNAPLSGGGKLREGLTLQLNYDAQNLKITAGQLTTAQAIHTGADVRFKSVKTDTGVTIDDAAGYVGTETFSGGFGGQGAKLQLVDGKWIWTVDNLVVRNRMDVYEIMRQQLRTGANFLLNEGHRVEQVQQVLDGSWSFNDEVDVFSPAADPNLGFADWHECRLPADTLLSFQVGDLIKRQEFSGRAVGVTDATVVAAEYGSSTVTDNSTPRSFTVFVDEGDPPAPGMDFARMGHRSDPARQNGIIITASGSGNPYQRVYAGVDRHARFGAMDTIRSQSGRLDNIVDADFPDLDGSQQNLYGTYQRGNSYVKGHIVVTGGNAETKDGALAKAQAAESSAKDYTDALQAVLDGILADAVTNGTTIIEGGFLKNSLINTQAIVVGDLGDGADYETKLGAQAKVNSLQQDLDDILDNAVANGTTIITGGVIASQFLLIKDEDGTTIISGGVLQNQAIKTEHLDAKAVTADKLDVTNLQAITTNTGSLTVNGNLNFAPGGSVTLPPNAGSGTGTLNRNGLLLALQQRLTWGAGTGDLAGVYYGNTNTPTPFAGPALNVYSASTLSVLSDSNVNIMAGLAGMVNIESTTSLNDRNLLNVRVLTRTTGEANHTASGNLTLNIGSTVFGLSAPNNPLIHRINLTGGNTDGSVIKLVNIGTSTFRLGVTGTGNVNTQNGHNINVYPGCHIDLVYLNGWWYAHLDHQ